MGNAGADQEEQLVTAVEEHLAELIERIEKIKLQYDVECRETSYLQLAAAKAKDKRDATWRYLTDMIEYKNKIDGEARNCDHKIQTEYSGRGLGYDHRCIKCGWFKNAFPEY
jgi:hypothetical protein